MSGLKPVTTYGKAGPGADLRMFMEKRLVVTVNQKRKIIGQLRGYDMFMNIVLDNAVEIVKPEVTRKIGTVIIRGNAVLTWECLDKVNI